MDTKEDFLGKAHHALKILGGMPVQVELFGSWFWTTDSSRKHANLLYSLGFGFDKEKKIWSLHLQDWKRHAKKISGMDEIQNNFGRVIIQGQGKQSAYMKLVEIEKKKKESEDRSEKVS